MQSIEEHIAHLSKTIDDLSDVIARQDKDIARLTQLVDILVAREKEREAQGGGGVIFGDERPPHY
ncbi:MAG: SlyX family protein [Planktomarina sp.]